MVFDLDKIKKYIKKFNLNKCYFYCLSLLKYSWCNLCKSKPMQKLISRFLGLSIAYEVNKTICIDYLYNGEVYKVYLPFERRYVNKMLNDVIEIHYEGNEGNEGTSENIKQQPGIPFFITPKHLGAKSATIYTLVEEKEIQENERIL